MEYDYYRVRYWIKTKDTHKIKGDNFATFKEAKEKYDSLNPDETLIQVELLREEHDHKGELIYENLLKIKDKESEKVWKD